MSYALTEIFEHIAQNINRKITGSFNNLNILMKDILEGKQANIIITDHADWITSFKQKGLINISSITNLVEDRLALVTSKEFYNFNSHKLAELIDYQAKANFYQNFTLFLPKWTDDMAGMYAHEALKNMKYLFNSKNKIIEILNPLMSLVKLMIRLLLFAIQNLMIIQILILLKLLMRNIIAVLSIKLLL